MWEPWDIDTFVSRLTKSETDYKVYFTSVGSCQVPISKGSHIGFPSGFLELKAKTLQVIIL